MKVWIALLLVLPAIAGCTDEPVPEIVTENHVLAVGTGAIAGLLVDDRFRPIELTDAPVSESQRTGFIVLLETGAQSQSNPNGEFFFVDLEPGRYTLRATLDGHEAKPVPVEVGEGTFSEATVLARRIASASSAIVTQEYSVFSFCAANVFLPLTDACNLLDLSGDSGRIFLDLDFTGVADQMTNLVTEFKANQAGNYYLLMGRAMTSLDAQYYLQEYVTGDYTGCVTPVGNLSEEKCLGSNVPTPFDVDQTFQLILYINGEYDDELNDVLFGLPLTGVGASLAIEGRFLFSAFLGEPEDDIMDYCLLCPK